MTCSGVTDWMPATYFEEKRGSPVTRRLLPTFEAWSSTACRLMLYSLSTSTLARSSSSPDTGPDFTFSISSRTTSMIRFGFSIGVWKATLKVPLRNHGV